jgi:hypothetical protein
MFPYDTINAASTGKNTHMMMLSVQQITYMFLISLVICEVEKYFLGFHDRLLIKFNKSDWL